MCCLAVEVVVAPVEQGHPAAVVAQGFRMGPGEVPQMDPAASFGPVGWVVAQTGLE